MIKALKTLLRRLGENRRLARFGAILWRRGSFRVPKSIRLGRRWMPLAYPNDLGAKEDFLTCFGDDSYGLASLNPRPKTVLDIGANVGFFSLAARSYFPLALIHAYEPNPRVLETLKSNAAEGGFLVHGEAVGGFAGWVTMIDESDSNQARTSRLDQNVSGAIQQVSLEQVIQRVGGHVDLLKMDCEGAEWDIFKAVDAWRNVGELRMEYHLTQGRGISDVHDALKALSFHITRQIDQNGFGTIWASNALRA